MAELKNAGQYTNIARYTSDDFALSKSMRNIANLVYIVSLRRKYRITNKLKEIHNHFKDTIANHLLVMENFKEMNLNDSSDEVYSNTPLKSKYVASNSSKSQGSKISSSNCCETPVRFNESTVKRGKLPNSFKGNLIKKMPIYSPPTNILGHVKNPFEHARLLKERLSQPICSPSLFEKIKSPVQEDQFHWSIEDISVLRPAPINENPTQEFDSWFSPATENEAQKAINQFFSSQIANMESPEDIRQNRPNDNSIKPLTVETWSQTMLTLPPNLPSELNNILSHYYTFSENQFNQDSEDLNCSISRKKLSFESLDTDLESICKTPVQLNNQCYKQTAASTPILSIVSSPELSPIMSDKPYQSPMDISIVCRSKTRLNLTNDVEMNVEDKENIQIMNWNQHGNNFAVNLEESPDSAFSSV